ncbi:MAG: hypothetical protein KI790_00210 [Cyclobacteriaceae bacterium]|nr:hypothetical protein [Cyclobacteriaceae bacterium HetDA_MAG_MS6]
MKSFVLHSLLAAVALTLCSFSTTAQSKIKEKDIIGTWKLYIAYEDEMEEEIDEEESVLGKILLKSVSGFVEGLLDNIEIYFEFEENNRARITVSAFGSEEIEYTEWRINRRGELILEDGGNVNVGDDDIWLLENGRLVAYDRGGHDKDQDDIYMIRVN